MRMISEKLVLLAIAASFVVAASSAAQAQPQQPTAVDAKAPKAVAAPVSAVKAKSEKNSKPEEKLEADPLRQALAEAYLKNPQLEAQRKAQNALDERVPQAFSGALPNIGAGYDKGRRRTIFGAGNWNYGDSSSETLNFTQPLFRGGTTWANIKSARRDVTAGQARLIQVEQEVLLNTVRAYMDVVQTKAVVDLNKKNLSVLQKQLEAASQRFEVGEDTRTDVAQSEARVAQAKSDLVASEGRYASAKAAFRRFVGYEVKQAMMPLDEPKLPETLEKAIELAESINPRLIEAKNLKESSDYQIDANIGRILPTVSVRGTVSRQEGAGIFGDSNFDQDEVALSVSMPLYQSGAEYSRVREAREQYQQRRFNEMDTATQVRQGVVSAWEEWVAAKASIESDQAAIEAAQVALAGVKQEQQYGARTTLEVLDAERELFNVEVRYVTSQRNEVTAAYTLLAAVGLLTAESIGLSVPIYDPNKHFEDVEYQFIGF